jgi:lysophospholipase L1-like esterase
MRRFALPLLVVLAASARSEPITVYLAGDSTMAPKLPEKRPETGWGERLQGFFAEDRVRIDNRAKNGRSTRSFLEEGSWQAIVDELRAGDYVLIQFGHNDGAKDRPDRYTPPEDYRRNLARFVTDARAKRAIPVLLTPVVRWRFDERGAFFDTHGEYPDVVRAVAAAHDVPLVDMHRKSRSVLERAGAEKSRALFLQLKAHEHANYPAGITDNTHFSPHGAETMAQLAVDGLREAKVGLVDYVKGDDAPRQKK